MYYHSKKSFIKNFLVGFFCGCLLLTSPLVAYDLQQHLEQQNLEKIKHIKQQQALQEENQRRERIRQNPIEEGRKAREQQRQIQDTYTHRSQRDIQRQYIEEQNTQGMETNRSPRDVQRTQIKIQEIQGFDTTRSPRDVQREQQEKTDKLSPEKRNISPREQQRQQQRALEDI